MLCCSTVVGLLVKEILVNQLVMNKNIVTCLPLCDDADALHPDSRAIYSAAYEEQIKLGKHNMGAELSESGVRMTSVTCQQFRCMRFHFLFTVVIYFITSVVSVVHVLHAKV